MGSPPATGRLTPSDPRAAEAAKGSRLQTPQGVPKQTTGLCSVSYYLQSRKFSTAWGHDPCCGLTYQAMHAKHACDDIAVFPLFFLYSAPFRCSRYTPLHHRPTIHRFSSILSIAVAHRASRLRRVDRRDLIAYMKRIRCMTRTDAIETHSRRRVFHDSAPPGFHV